MLVFATMFPNCSPPFFVAGTRSITMIFPVAILEKAERQEFNVGYLFCHNLDLAAAFILSLPSSRRGMALSNHYVWKKVPCSFNDPDGLLVDCPQKVYVYKQDGSTYWESRLFVLATHKNVKKCFRFAEFIKENRTLWESMLASLGVADGLKPSSKAAVHWDVTYLTDPKVRQEFTFSTQATSCFLVWGSQCVGKNEEKRRYTQLLEKFFGMVGVSNDNFRGKLLELIGTFREECLLMNSQLQQTCWHVDAFCVGLTPAANWANLAKGCSTSSEKQTHASR